MAKNCRARLVDISGIDEGVCPHLAATLRSDHGDASEELAVYVNLLYLEYRCGRGNVSDATASTTKMHHYVRTQAHVTDLESDLP